MKKLFFLLLAGLFSTVILFSCHRNDDDENIDNSTGNAATLTAEQYGFDGANAGKFSSTKAGIVRTSAAGVTIITISGIRDGGKESVNMVLYGDVAANKVYTLGNGSQNGIVFRKDYQNVTDQSMSYSTDNNGANMSGGGEVKITSVNGNKIEGTFYAVGYNNSKREAFAEQGKFSGTIN
ncbi:hypothetical protein [Epilithonimonas sp.]|uniref:hypothetical protein n=1 Tax=Epilithonimonas sp. TaxID=2894511 RepID=UPI0035AF3216